MQESFPKEKYVFSYKTLSLIVSVSFASPSYTHIEILRRHRTIRCGAFTIFFIYQVPCLRHRKASESAWIRRLSLSKKSSSDPISLYYATRHSQEVGALFFWRIIRKRLDKDENGNKLFANNTNYSVDGERESTWFVDKVKKYHRTFSTIINTLIEAGFQINKLIEPVPTPEALKEHPAYNDLLHKPDFLIIKAIKITSDQ